MMRECEDHGYFRDEVCPVCGEEGRFLMNDFEMERLGRQMAGILRHGKYDLPMDDRGFVRTRDLISAIKEHNPRMHCPKGRYQISGDTIRATYGHTIDLDLRLPTDNIPDELYYPASEDEAEIILEVGLKPSDRAKVHLSLTYQDAYNAGSVRLDQPVILAIDVDRCFDEGYDIGRAGKTVFLCDQVPADCIRIIHEEELND